MASILSQRIAQLRRERGLTQEELGAPLGVSAQAVSKWEKGGAPDVELLPALADRLGVSVDALFGREGGEAVDIDRAVSRWLHSVPPQHRLDRICRLHWTMTKNTVDDISVPDLGYLERSTLPVDDETPRELLATARIWLEGGFMLSLHAEDFSFASVWPEPADGYDAHFAPKADCRRLFAALARPGCLEVLEYLYSTPLRLYVPEAVARTLGLPAEEVRAILSQLADLTVLERSELELADGPGCAYSRRDGDMELVPFLYLARCLMQGGCHMFNIGGTGRFPLRGGVWPRAEQP